MSVAPSRVKPLNPWTSKLRFTLLAGCALLCVQAGIVHGQEDGDKAKEESKVVKAAENTNTCNSNTSVATAAPVSALPLLALATSLRPGMNAERYFSECTCRDFPMVVRDKYREHLLNTIEATHGKGDTITITSFASGKLGMDFKLVQELIKKGYEKININVIDNAYYSGKSGDLASYVEKFQEYVERWNRGGSAISFYAVGSLQVYVEMAKDGDLPLSDYILDVDSGGVFKAATAVQGLKKGGVIKSLDAGWITDEESGKVVGQGNFLNTIGDDGEVKRELFYMRVKIKE